MRSVGLQIAAIWASQVITGSSAWPQQSTPVSAADLSVCEAIENARLHIGTVVRVRGELRWGAHSLTVAATGCQSLPRLGGAALHLNGLDAPKYEFANDQFERLQSIAARRRSGYRGPVLVTVEGRLTQSLTKAGAYELLFRRFVSIAFPENTKK